MEICEFSPSEWMIYGEKWFLLSANEEKSVYPEHVLLNY